MNEQFFGFGHGNDPTFFDIPSLVCLTCKGVVNFGGRDYENVSPSNNIGFCYRFINANSSCKGYKIGYETAIRIKKNCGG